MIKISFLFVFVLIGVVFTLPSGDSVNQRDPVQIKTTNEEQISELVKDENLAPILDQDLNEPAIKDENLEPAETFGLGYGIGYGGGYRAFGGYRGGYGYGSRDMDGDEATAAIMEMAGEMVTVGEDGEITTGR